MKKTIVQIGGAESQCHGIEILKNMGHRVIVVDADSNCMGARIADVFYNISTADVDAIEKIAIENKADIVYAVQSDLGTITAAKVSERLGLKNIPIEVAELFTNKFLMRGYLSRNDFLYPSYKKCNSRKDIEDFVYEYGCPFVIKPLDSQGSRGVHIIDSLDELNNIDDISKFNRDTTGVIVESYLGDDEYTVEGIVVDGRHYTLGISQKTHYKDLKCVSKELYYVWKPEYEELALIHNEMIEKTGLKFGITHSEYIKGKNGFTLVEFAARGGGSMISSHIVPAISGWDVEELYIKELLDEKIDIVEPTRKAAVLKFIELEEDYIKSISGINTINGMKNVLHFELHYAEGDLVKPVENDTNRHGFYIAYADSESELKKIMEKVEGSLIVKYGK